MSPYTNDLFMGTLNTLTTPSSTAGNPSSKTAILPNPNLGGFTTSNPPGALPKTAPTEEKFGQRMFVPSPYGAGLRHLADARRLPADAAADQHGLRLRRAFPTRRSRATSTSSRSG